MTDLCQTCNRPVADHGAAMICPPISTCRHGELARVCPACDEIAKLRGQLDTARKTNNSLNRRLQSAESGLAVKLDAAKRQGGSLGRTLANAGATMVDAQNAKLRAALEEIANDAKCNCDPAYTDRGLCEPNALCHLADIATKALGR